MVTTTISKVSRVVGYPVIIVIIECKETGKRSDRIHFVAGGKTRDKKDGFIKLKRSDRVYTSFMCLTGGNGL